MLSAWRSELLRQGHNHKGTDPPRTSWSWSQKNHEDMLIILEDILISIMKTCYFRRYLVIYREENLILRTCWSREHIWSSIMRTSWSQRHTDHENLFDHPSWGQVDHEDMLIKKRTYLVIHHEDKLIMRTCWSWRELIWLTIMRTGWS